MRASDHPTPTRRQAGAALLSLLAGCAVPSAPPSPPRPAPKAGPAATIATLSIPGDPRFVVLAREVMLLQSRAAPDFASQAGLIDDALALPSFAPARVDEQVARLGQVLQALRALPWRTWDVQRQIDLRWVYANALRLQRELAVEKLYLHRPAAWLESLANNFLNIVTYAPQRDDALALLTAGIPALVAEMRAVCRPAAVDAAIAQGVLDGIVALLGQRPADAARGAALQVLAGYRALLADGSAAPAYRVIGADNYAWRLRHASLLPWSPEELRALAQQRQAEVDQRIAALQPRLGPAPAADAPLPPELEQDARRLDQALLLRLYDRIQQRNRAFIEARGFITIPPGVGAVKARVTPDAMVPLTGDGGSMNPPPPFIDDDTAWWNVEHFNPALTLAQRRERVRNAALYQSTGMGPYAVHEGLPGHHLQLAIARLNPNPLRSVFADPVQNEGWALYAEELMWQQGGLGDTVQAEFNMLRSWRFRIRRVIHDVNVETGVWTLQQAADWRAGAAPGQGRIDPDIQRSINWPAQLVCYFAGKEQIVQLKADCRARWGTAYSERRFHDELLALGSLPVALARSALLGEAVLEF